MTAPLISAGASGGEPLAPAGPYRDWLTEEMDRQHAAGLPNLDNVGGGAVDYDGPRCADCRCPIDPVDGDTHCLDCEPDDEPHFYVCPTCGGNGCRACGGTGERLDTTRPDLVTEGPR